MKIPGANRLKKVVRKTQKSFSPKAIILMYHRIAEVQIDPFSLCVTSECFAEHLEVIRKHAYPLHLSQLAHAHQNGRIPNRAVVITFDDGYADNFYQAKPLLERFDLPATFFISTGYLESEGEFWWDELERLLLKPGKLPEKLHLDINGSIHQWHLGKAIEYSEADYRRDRNAKPWEAKSGSRLSFYYSIWKQLLPLPESEQLKVLAEIQSWSQSDSSPRSSYRSLSNQELIALGDGDLIEIGAHTVSHPFLSAHSVTQQQQEIQQSKLRLEDLLNRPITSFSYPFGNSTEETVELVRSMEFDCACSTVEDTVWKKSDRFQLPRFCVQNWNGEEFSAKLLDWFHR